jgi:GNAT superfamily N-acetyltransferase
MSISIRLAGLQDLTRLVIFGRRAHESSHLAHIPYNADITRATFRGAVLLKGQDVFIAERADGSLCGFLIALTAPLPSCRAKYATDAAFYAEAGGDRLLDAFIAWAKARHAACIYMGVTQDDPGDRIRKLYTRKGLTPTGGMYWMKFSRGNEP